MWWFYSPEDDADIDHLKVDTSSLKVSLSYYIGVTKITISSKTKENVIFGMNEKLGASQARPRKNVIFGMNEKLGGRSATVPHHTHLLKTVVL